MKESFIFFETWAEAIRHLPDKERLQVYDAIMAYGIYGAKTEVGGLAQMALNLVFNDIDNCKTKRKEKAEKARESANKRWQNQNANQCERMQTDANACVRMQSDATRCYNVNVNVNGNVNEDVNGVLFSAEKSAQPKAAKKTFDYAQAVAELEPEIKDSIMQCSTEIETWIEYKKTEFRKGYKTATTFKAFLKHLFELGNGNPETMKAIIEQSIANRYQGIFELKKSFNHGNYNDPRSADYIPTERIVECGFAMAKAGM